MRERRRVRDLACDGKVRRVFILRGEEERVATETETRGLSDPARVGRW